MRGMQKKKNPDFDLSETFAKVWFGRQYSDSETTQYTSNKQKDPLFIQFCTVNITKMTSSTNPFRLQTICCKNVNTVSNSCQVLSLLSSTVIHLVDRIQVFFLVSDLKGTQ